MRMLPERFEGITFDEYVIMPNHMHGVIMITTDRASAKSDACLLFPNYLSDRAPARGAPTDTSFSNSVGAGLASALHIKHAAIGDIVGSFKSITSNEWLKVVESENTNTRGKFWQRNYYEHVIRNEDELNGIRQYVIDNPLKWELDEENPTNVKRPTKGNL